MQHAEGLVHEKQSKHTIDITAEELSILLYNDETLECVHKAADKYPAKQGVGFYHKDICCIAGRYPQIEKKIECHYSVEKLFCR